MYAIRSYYGWATREQQARNTRKTVRLTLGGVTLSVPEWAERLGMKRHNIYNRLKAGWAIEEVLDPRIRPKGQQRGRQKSEKLREQHGMSGTPTYLAWQAMISRCTNPRHPAWDDYGGRGITVCDRWVESFLAFLKDMGPCHKGLSLDRVIV